MATALETDPTKADRSGRGVWAVFDTSSHRFAGLELATGHSSHLASPRIGATDVFAVL
jgi:hypothetical protein